MLSALMYGFDACSEVVGFGGSLHLKRQEKYSEAFWAGNGWCFFLSFKVGLDVKIFSKELEVGGKRKGVIAHVSEGNLWSGLLSQGVPFR